MKLSRKLNKKKVMYKAIETIYITRKVIIKFLSIFNLNQGCWIVFYFK